MNKKLTIVIIILLLIVATIVWSSISLEKNDVLSTNHANIIKINDFKTYNYIHSMFTGNFQDKILIYDKTTLRLIDNKLEEVFSSNIQSNNYKISTNDDYIFFLDTTHQQIYKIDSKGVVVSQKKIDQLPTAIVPLKNSNLLVQYTTNVNVDGILYLDENLNTINNITYPDTTINSISQDKISGNILITTLMKGEINVVNKIFFYNENFDLVLTNSYENMVATSVDFFNDKIILLDPDFAYIVDNNQLSYVDKIASADYFRQMVICENNFHILDGMRKILHVEKNLDTKEEFLQNSDIIGIFNHMDKPVYYSSREINYNANSISTQNDIHKCFSLNKNGIAIVFRNGLKVIHPKEI